MSRWLIPIPIAACGIRRVAPSRSDPAWHTILTGKPVADRSTLVVFPPLSGDHGETVRALPELSYLPVRLFLIASHMVLHGNNILQ